MQWSRACMRCDAACIKTHSAWGHNGPSATSEPSASIGRAMFPDPPDERASFGRRREASKGQPWPNGTAGGMDREPSSTARPSSRWQGVAARVSGGGRSFELWGHPAESKGRSFASEGIPRGLADIPSDPKSLPFDSKGMPSGSEDIPFDLKDFPSESKAFPFAARGISYADPAALAGREGR